MRACALDILCRTRSQQLNVVLSALNLVESHPPWLDTTTWWDALREYNTLPVIFKAKLWVPSQCLSTPWWTSVKRNHGGSSRITNPLYGIVLIGRTASSQKIQTSLPAVLLWPVKGKERGRTDTQVTQGLAAKEKGEHSCHWHSWPKSQNDTQTLLQLPLLSQNRYWSRGECRTRRAIQTPVSTVKLQPRRCPAWTYERLQIQWLLPSGVTP